MAILPKTGSQFSMWINLVDYLDPTWTQICPHVEDASIPDFTMGMAEFKRRSNLYTKNLPTLIQPISFEFKLWYLHDDTTGGALLREAFLSGAVLDIFIASSPDITAVGSHTGWRLPLIVEQFPWDQALEDVSSIDVRMVLGYTTQYEDDTTEVDPDWYTWTVTTTTTTTTPAP